MLNYFLKIYNFIKIYLSPNLIKFYFHNKKYFHFKINKDNKSIILIEFNKILSAQITYPYLLSILQKKFNSNIVSYTPDQVSLFIYYLNLILYPLKLGIYSIYKSFGVSKLLSPNYSYTFNKKDKIILDSIITREDLLNLKVNGIWIGDLIYDSYLQKYNLPTVDLQSKRFKLFLNNSIKIFYYWINFFKVNKVSAVCVSHCCYLNALPLRVAIYNNIDGYMIHLQKFYKLDKDNLFADNDFILYREIFKKFTDSEKKKYLKAAFERINLRFQGVVGVDMAYSKKTAYSNNFKKYRLIKKSSKIKILIAAHCFSDSPHGHGIHLFNDFFEWIEYLGMKSNTTDYEWYIKSHPDFKNTTKKIIYEFANKFKKFNILPSDSSHHQIISEGINFALTCVGTIGFEYAMMGIPVINASQNNPHIAYNFNIHPKNIEDYSHTLNNLKNIKLDINKNEIAEYYYMNNIYNTNKLFFNNYEGMENKLGGYKKQFDPKVFKYWIKEFKLSKHKKILKTIENHISSGEYRLTNLD